MFNFRDIASLFLENEAALLVHTKEELERNIRDLLNNSSRVTGLGQRAKALVLENQGATRRNLEYIRNYLSVRGG
jgi:3-deoxy-D-manno-octulosonic-acid transferase